MKHSLLFLLLLFFHTYLAAAQDQGATIVSLTGKVTVFAPVANYSYAANVKFDEKLFTPRKAKVGMTVRVHEVLKADDSSNAKVILANGDQIMVGPATAYVMMLPGPKPGQEKRSLPSALRLYYGKFRAVISPSGPRKNLRIFTSVAVSGVRGTDFYVSHSDEDGTSVSVLRGEVTLRARTESNETVVRTGYSAVVEKGKPVQVNKTAAAQLLAIRKLSQETPGTGHDLSPEVKREVQRLNELARRNVIQDMLNHTPDLRKTHPSLDKDSLDILNERAVGESENGVVKAPNHDKKSSEKKHGH